MSARIEPLLHYLRRLTAQSINDASDALLLERFASQRDESAFAALLARHGPMVLGVCRRILRDGHDAEDAFQTTFLVLARKAASLRRPEALASWLYGTARHIASTTRRADSRRDQRETHWLQSTAPPSPADLLDELSARELLLAMDEELTRLPETYRLPLILCYLEGCTHEEAARRLGWTAASVRGRLQRGRARLRTRMVRRGLTLSASLLSLESMVASMVSAELRQATVQKALVFAASSAEGIAANFLELAEIGTAGISMTRAKAGLVLLLLTMGFIAGASAPFYRVRMEKPAEAKQGGRTQTEKPELAKHVRTDRYGDPMPPGAVTRLGSIRLRHGGHVMSVVFAPDGKTLVSGGFDGWAFLWGVATGKRLRVFRQDAIKSVAIDPAGKTAALASYSDGTVKLYELTTGKEVATFPGNRGGTESVDFSPDGKLLASASKDGKSICLWNVSNARQVWFSRANRRLWLPSLKFTPNGKYLICVDDEGALRYWDVATGGERKPPGLLTALRVYSFCFSADNKILATGGRDAAGSLQFWDAASGKEVRTIARTRMPMYGIVLAPGGKSVWTQSGSDDLLQWDVASGKQLVRLPHSLNDIRSFALSPDGKSLATGDHSGNVSLWDAKTGQKALNFEGHRGLATAAVFTPDGRQLWTGGNDFTIRLWSAASGEQLRQFSTQCGNDHVYDMALRPDGKMLAMAVIRRTSNSAAEKCDVRLWDLTTNTESKPLRGHGGWVYTVAFSPDGRTIASRSEDQTIRV